MGKSLSLYIYLRSSAIAKSSRNKDYNFQIWRRKALSTRGINRCTTCLISVIAEVAEIQLLRGSFQQEVISTEHNSMLIYLYFMLIRIKIDIK